MKNDDYYDFDPRDILTVQIIEYPEVEFEDFDDFNEEKDWDIGGESGGA